MNKLNKNSFFKNKALVFFLVILVILFVINDYSNDAISAIAVVVGIGIDDAPNGDFDVSCEVLVPLLDGSSGSTSKNVVLTAKGGTIAEAIDNVFKRVGWFPKLNYCNLIIISKAVAIKSGVNALSYFLKSEKIMDSALVVIANERAVEILETSTPLDQISAQAVQKIAMQKYKQGSNIIEINLKDFMRNFYDIGINDVVSIVKTKKADGGQSEEEKQKIKKPGMEVFDLTNSALFSQGKLVGEINSDLTNAFIFTKENASGSTLFVKDVSIPYVNDGNKTDITLDIATHKSEIKVKFENGKPKLEISVKMAVRFGDSSKREDLLTLASIDTVPKEALESAQRKLKFDTMELFQICQTTKSDIYAVGKSLNKYDNKNWKKYLINCENPKEYLQDTDIIVTVEIVNIK